MPRAPRTQAEVDKIREQILETALDVIIKDGFHNLSLRKIASRLGVTPTTIYNYYKNKDELNLMIRVRGFEKLHHLLTERSARLDDLEDRLAAMIRGYIEFGLTCPSYYDIMFNLHTPKYLDYVGTDIEPLAHHEKQNALKCLALFVDPLAAYIPGTGADRERFLLYRVVRFWSDLHGLITLCNSRLFHEVLDEVDDFVEARTADLIGEFSRLKKQVDAGEILF